MKINFITFSDEKFKHRQKELTKQAEDLFDVVYEYDREWLIETEFYKENKHILDQKKGAGFCLWKPFLILKTLKNMDYGDIIFYIDSADTFDNEIKDFFKGYFSNDNHEIILTSGAYPNKDWTKRDCFILMGCDTHIYHDAIQLEAGVLVVKKTERMISFIEEWLEYCKNENIITTIENIHGVNFPSYKDHRYDQSVLTNLSIRHGINGTNVLRKFTKCNVYG